MQYVKKAGLLPFAMMQVKLGAVWQRTTFLDPFSAKMLFLRAGKEKGFHRIQKIGTAQEKSMQYVKKAGLLPFAMMQVKLGAVWQRNG